MSTTSKQITKIIFLLCILVILPACQAKCTGNLYPPADGGACAPCGINSNSNGTDCNCISSFARFAYQKFDYSKPCYRIPSKPRNLELVNKTYESVFFKWDPPTDVDTTLESRYLILLYKCQIVNNRMTCRTVHAKEINNTKTTWSTGGLEPTTTYRMIVCSSNDMFINNTFYNGAHEHDSCNADELRVTDDGPPGPFKAEYFKANVHPLEKNQHIFQFRAPTSFGGPSVKEWSAHIECDDSKSTKIKETYNSTAFPNDEHTFYIKTEKICANTVRCEFYASNQYGNSEKKIKLFQFNDDCDPSNNNNTLVIVVVVVFVIVVLVIAGVLIYLWRWRKGQARMEQLWLLQLERANNVSNNMVMPFRAHNLYVDAMEVEQTLEKEFAKQVDLADEESNYLDSLFDFEYHRQNLVFKYKLGEGQFGCVYKAEATDIAGKPGKSTVAVKVLKENPEEKDKQEFIDELDLLKLIKPHPNVVRLLGCCTKRGQQLAMIFEVMPSGDLQNLLRKTKKRADNTNRPIDEMIDIDEFLRFAIDIANGMDHLSFHKIVHRDLAARNVLVGSNRVCKISDMGLARPLNEDGVFHREKEAKLPIKWMSPESIKYGRSSIKSDVWSFGIVLWEIFTLGASPYPGFKSKDVPALLCHERYRMSKPEHCSDQLFEIILDCWEEAFDLRPTFENLMLRIKRLKDGDEKCMSFEYYNEDAYLTSQDGGFENFDDEVLFNELQLNKQNAGGGKTNPGYEPSQVRMTNGSVRYIP